jgi:hypothetical protein
LCFQIGKNSSGILNFDFLLQVKLNEFLALSLIGCLFIKITLSFDIKVEF